MRAERLGRAAVGELRGLEAVVPVAAGVEEAAVGGGGEACRGVALVAGERHAEAEARRARRVDVEGRRGAGLERRVWQPAVARDAPVGGDGDEPVGARGDGEQRGVGERSVEVEPRLRRRRDERGRALGVRRVGRGARRVRPVEQLRRRVAEVVDLRLGRGALARVGDRVEVDGALVREVVEDVERALG